MSKKDNKADCPAFPTGDIAAKENTETVGGVQDAPPATGEGFRYIGPSFRNGCYHNCRKIYMDKWTEEQAKAEIAQDEFYAKYFQF